MVFKGVSEIAISFLKLSPGGLFEDYVEDEGWSSKNYMDIDNHKDPQMCSAYAAEIYHHLRMAEVIPQNIVRL